MAGSLCCRPLVAAARPPDLFNRAKHLFDSAKGRAGLTVAPDPRWCSSPRARAAALDALMGPAPSER
jgi:hypothetical protein